MCRRPEIQDYKHRQREQDFEKQYQENLERARDLSSLGLAVVDSYKQRQALNPDDLKKLEKVEKLARGIRNAAGGSDDDEPLDNPPQQLDKALSRLADLSEQLHKSVQKTSRLVISAAVINHSNELIELIKQVRNIKRP